MKKKIYNKKELFLILIFLIFLSFFIVQIRVFYLVKKEYNELSYLYDEYRFIIEEIDNYKLLKQQYEIILGESVELGNNSKELEDKINNLKSEISKLESQINDVNKKIKNLS